MSIMQGNPVAGPSTRPMHVTLLQRRLGNTQDDCHAADSRALDDLYSEPPRMPAKSLIRRISLPLFFLAAFFIVGVAVANETDPWLRPDAAPAPPENLP